MARKDVVDSLIATYRELNLQLRPLGEAKLAAAGPDGSVKDVLKDLRRREIIASQQLKAMLMAEASGDTPAVVDASLIDSGDDLPARVLLSEFGTARESILAAASQRSDEELSRELNVTEGPRSIDALLQSLVESDRVDRERIKRLLAAS
ncbi:MAG: hypothetical protein DCC58_13865 [Chloroflexi bacterium]|nr:MAG: hypothetical protein DCC58_13865 [Chloroflexota bacterium]